MKFRNGLLTMTALFAFAATSSAQEPAAKPADTPNKTADTKPNAVQTTAAKDQAAAQTPTAAKGTTPDDPDYVIGVEDSLMINVWHEPEISHSVSVRPDGKISL